MAAYPVNVWMITESDFESFTYTGGKVIYIAEDMDFKFKTHPAIVTAGVLLPPVDAVACIIDGEMEIAAGIYYDYLLNSEASMYINIILAAAIQETPIGIMFGQDEINMGSPSIFLNFLYHYYGLVVGVMGSVNPCIEEAFMPNNMASLYNMSIIDSKTYFEKHPPHLPISDQAISKLAYEINPLVSQRDFQHYYEYFNNLKNTIHNNNGKYLVDMMEGI